MKNQAATASSRSQRRRTTDADCPGAIFVANSHGEIVFANNALRRLFPPDSPVRVEVADLPPADAPEGEFLMRLGVRSQPLRRIRVVCRPAAAERHLLYTCTAVESPRRRFESRAELSPFGVYVLQDGHFVYTNRAFVAMTRLTPGQLAGTRPASLVAPHDRRRIRREAARVLLGDSNHRYEYHLHAAGHEQLVIETVRPVHWEGRSAVIGCALAVDEATRALDLFRAATEHFERAEAASPEVFALAGVAGRFLYVNDAHEEVLGYTRDEMLGMRAQDLVHPDDQSHFQQSVRRHIRLATPLDATLRLRRRDGSWRWFESRIEMIYDDDDRFAGTAAVSNDITARRRLARRLSRVVTAARTPEEELAAFASSLAEDSLELSIVSARAALAGPGTGIAVPSARAGEALHAIAATLLAGSLNPAPRRLAA